MSVSKKSGAAIAATAAAFLLSGTATATVAVADETKVQCFGVNACKGQGACKTASNECKGQNACKSQGFVLLTGPDCTAKGGKTTQG